MNSGYIKAYNPEKGFGFITRPKGKELFFHHTDFVENEVVIGIEVTFDIVTNGKFKNKAINVKPAPQSQAGK